jgi:hypothetical protein
MPWNVDEQHHRTHGAPEQARRVGVSLREIGNKPTLPIRIRHTL